MQIFNKGQRKFTLETMDIEPGKMAEVADKEGKKLLAMFPEELILASEVKVKPANNKELEEANKQLEEANKQLEEANKQLETLNSDLEVAKADLKAVTEERNDLKKQLKELKK